MRNGNYLRRPVVPKSASASKERKSGLRPGKTATHPALRIEKLTPTTATEPAASENSMELSTLINFQGNIDSHSFLPVSISRDARTTSPLPSILPLEFLSGCLCMSRLIESAVYCMCRHGSVSGEINGAFEIGQILGFPSPTGYKLISPDFSLLT